MIEAGKLRHRVQIIGPAYAQDQDTGEAIPTNDLIATVWAAVEPVSGRDFIAAQATQSKISARITIRYRDISSDMKIRHNGTEYRIDGILPDKDSGLEYLTLLASKI